MKYHPLKELVLCRLRQFYREPEAVFWTYGFPLILIVGLGIAFRNRPPDKAEVDVEESPASEAIVSALSPPAAEGFDLEVHPADVCAERLRLGKTTIVVQATTTGYTYQYDPTRPESAFARARVDGVLQRAAGRQDLRSVRNAADGARRRRNTVTGFQLKPR